MKIVVCCAARRWQLLKPSGSCGATWPRRLPRQSRSFTCVVLGSFACDLAAAPPPTQTPVAAVSSPAHRLLAASDVGHLSWWAHVCGMMLCACVCVPATVRWAGGLRHRGLHLLGRRHPRRPGPLRAHGPPRRHPPGLLLPLHGNLARQHLAPRFGPSQSIQSNQPPHQRTCTSQSMTPTFTFPQKMIVKRLICQCAKLCPWQWGQWVPHNEPLPPYFPSLGLPR